MSILTAGAELAEDDASLWAAVGTMFPGQYQALAAFSFLVFNLLNSPCLAAISTMSHEMNDRKWTWGALAFQNINAYLITLMIYQLGKLFLYGSFGVGTIFAIATAAFYIYGAVRKDKYVGMEYEVRRSVDAA